MIPESYELLVKKGQELLKSDERMTSDMCWAWGDLALEVVPQMEGPGRNRGVEKELHRFAQDIGWFASGRKIRTLMDYRNVAAAWLPSTRVDGTSFSAHQVLAYQQELLQPGMTQRQAEQAAGHQRKEPKSLAQEKAQDLAEAAHEVNEDPEAQVEAKKDPEVRKEVLAAADSIAESFPIEVPAAPGKLEIQIEGELQHARNAVRRAYQLCISGDRPGDDEDIIDLFDLLGREVEATKEAYISGQSLDSELTELLSN